MSYEQQNVRGDTRYQRTHPLIQYRCRVCDVCLNCNIRYIEKLWFRLLWRGCSTPTLILTQDDSVYFSSHDSIVIIIIKVSWKICRKKTSSWTSLSTGFVALNRKTSRFRGVVVVSFLWISTTFGEFKQFAIIHIFSCCGVFASKTIFIHSAAGWRVSVNNLLACLIFAVWFRSERKRSAMLIRLKFTSAARYPIVIWHVLVEHHMDEMVMMAECEKLLQCGVLFQSWIQSFTHRIRKKKTFHTSPFRWW